MLPLRHVHASRERLRSGYLGWSREGFRKAEGSYKYIAINRLKKIKSEKNIRGALKAKLRL